MEGGRWKKKMRKKWLELCVYIVSLCVCEHKVLNEVCDIDKEFRKRGV